MDVTSAYDLEVHTPAPIAEVVYDLLHVAAGYGRDVTNRVPLDEASILRADKPARCISTTSRWPLLRDRRNVQRDHAVRPQARLAANRALMIACVLKDDLMQRLAYRSEVWSWKQHVTRSGVQPLRRFARCLTPDLPGSPGPLPLAAKHQSGQGQRQHDQGHQAKGNGSRADACFFLKIRATFSGLG